MKLLFVIVTLLAISVTVAADVTWELDGISIDTMPTASYTFTDAASALWIGGGLDSCRISGPEPDSSTHYLDGLDTVLSSIDVECDTVWNRYRTDSLSGYIIDTIVCDTIYRMKAVLIWLPLVTVKLRPDQVEMLMFLLSSVSDTTIGGRRVLRYNIPTAYITDDCGDSGYDNWALYIESKCLDHGVFWSAGKPDSVVQR